MAKLEPFYGDVQAHYDLSNDFFAIFLDETMTYSCAYFERADMTLHEAQLAKIDLSLGKLDLRPGLRLLEVGCGWGATLQRAAERFGTNGIGLTLSKNQLALATDKLKKLPPAAGNVELRLCGWEEFEEPVDRIVSIGAFEHFRAERYTAFFEKCHSLLPAGQGARMMLHTILVPDENERRAKNIEMTHENVLFGKFIRKYIFPGGQLCPAAIVIKHATAAGFRVERTQSLQLHYARTLDCWAERLTAARERAIAITSQGVYDMYMHYLVGCAAHFRSGHIDVMQFTLCRD